MSDGFREKRLWLEVYCGRLDQDTLKDFPNSLRVTCPCCGYPTLFNRGSYQSCRLCRWEDDGQDDYDADEVWGGPNGHYSLSEARENFEQYWIKDDPYDEDFGHFDSELALAAKKLACISFDEIREMLGADEADEAIRLNLLHTIKECFATLDAEKRRRMDEYEAQFKE